MLISAICHQRTSQKYFNYFRNYRNTELPCGKIYWIARKVLTATYGAFTIKSSIICFINVLCLNKKLLQFGKTDTPLCSFCKIDAEISLHLFNICSATKKRWNQPKLLFTHDLDFPFLSKGDFDTGVFL